MQGHSEQATDVKGLSIRALEGSPNYSVNGLEYSCEDWAFSSMGMGTSALNRAERCCSAFVIPGPIDKQRYAR